MKIKHWIEAFRLRTLLLSFSLIIMGSTIAYCEGDFNTVTFVMALLTTLFLQILSNIANDYGDAVSGADYAGRVGPARQVQSGAISRQEMKRAIYVFVILSLVSGVMLLMQCKAVLGWNGVLKMFLLGVASIMAAICYTVGKKPYGYMGLGDVFVFVFFGLVGVEGSYVLYGGELSLWVLLPASSVGLLSMAVLNMNNMRDMVSDNRSGKKTIIVRHGIEWGKKYQTVLVIGAFVLMGIYVCFQGSVYQYGYMIAIPIFAKHLVEVWRNKESRLLDGQLKVVSMGTLVMVMGYVIGTILEM